MMELLARNSGDDYRLLILCQGSLADWITTNADCKAPGRVRLIGHVADRERVADIRANCDILKLRYP